MSDRKHRLPDDKPDAVKSGLKNLEENTEAFFGKIERTLENSAKRAEASMERLEENIQNKVGRLDQWFEETEEKLDIILQTDGLKKHFKQRHGRGEKTGSSIRAVDGVDIDIVRGETLGIVGESGCGKSTIARIMIGLIEPSEGNVTLFGKDLATCTKQERRAIRRRTGIVFQDPYGSLDPRMTVADIISEPLRAYKLGANKTEQLLRAMEILEACGMSADDLFKFPHQFSGGQRQRICIARALVADPDIVVCDEAVSALDVSIQAQIINLLCDLREANGLTYIFISHDLDVVRFIADRIAVMYMGQVVEIAAKNDLFEQPAHPYTVDLLQSAPVFGRRIDEHADEVSVDQTFADAMPSAEGCRYVSRCRMALPECSVTEPKLRRISATHLVACHCVAAAMAAESGQDKSIDKTEREDNLHG